MTVEAADHDDAWFDRTLRGVPLPAGLDERLRLARAGSDAELDQALRAVPIPRHLERRCRQSIARGRRHQFWQRSVRPVIRSLIAACWLVLLAGSYTLATLGSLSLTFTREPVEQPRLFAEAIIPVDPIVESWLPEVPQFSLTPSSLPSDWTNGRAQTGLDDPGDRVERRRPPPLAAGMNGHEVDPRWGDDSVAAAVADELDDWAHTVVPRRDMSLPRGVDLALSQPGDRQFLAQRGVSPRIVVSDQGALAIPLTASAGGFSAVLEQLRQGVWPAPEQVRTESFLAAFAASGRTDEPGIRLTLSAGPSPTGGPDERWVHLGVHLPKARRINHPATHFTLVIDDSAALADAGRLALLRDACRGLLEQCGEQDRVSLWFCGASTEWAGEFRAVDETAWSALWQKHRSGGVQNLAAGLVLGIGSSREAAVPAGTRRRVTLVAGDDGEIPAAARPAVRSALTLAEQEGIDVRVLRLIEPRGGNSPAALDLGEGRTLRGTDSRRVAEIHSHLVESLTGRSLALMHEARLALRWARPQVVRYRWLGHEPTSAQVLPAEGPITLYAGESISIMFEIQTAPGTPSTATTWGTARLEWRVPRTGEPRRLEQRLLRSQGVSTWQEASPEWQGACLAVLGAEVLRGSPFAERVSLAEVVARGRQASPALLAEPRFRDWLQCLERAEGIRPGRGASRPVPGR